MTKEAALASLDPVAQPKFATFLKNLEDKGFKYFISEARRPLTTQMAYYTRGRMHAEDVQTYYKAAGLYAISAAEAATGPITWTLDSKHIKGMAMDIYPATADGKPNYSAKPADFQPIADAAKAAGLKWGGDFPDAQKDYPHVEY